LALFVPIFQVRSGNDRFVALRPVDNASKTGVYLLTY
jgi:hypothetical protein